MDFPNFYHVYTLLHGHIANKKVDEIAFLHIGRKVSMKRSSMKRDLNMMMTSN